jgi:protein PsiE
MSDGTGKELELHKQMRTVILPIGHFLSEAFHLIGLFAIGATTIWAGAAFFIQLMGKASVTIEDLLLLFIYLEIGSMVGVYFKTNHMPLRFIVYIAITAVTRHLIGYVNHEIKPDGGLLILAGAILVLALAVLVIRFASAKYGGGPGISPSMASLADSEDEARLAEPRVPLRT